MPLCDTAPPVNVSLQSLLVTLDAYWSEAEVTRRRVSDSCEVAAVRNFDGNASRLKEQFEGFIDRDAEVEG